MSAKNGPDSGDGRCDPCDAWLIVAAAWTDAAAAWFSRSNPERARQALVEALSSFHVHELAPGEGIEIIIVGRTLTEGERRRKEAYGSPEEATKAIADEIHSLMPH